MSPAYLLMDRRYARLSYLRVAARLPELEELGEHPRGGVWRQDRGEARGDWRHLDFERLIDFGPVIKRLNHSN
jgi:hypothetical protein